MTAGTWHFTGTGSCATGSCAAFGKLVPPNLKYARKTLYSWPTPSKQSAFNSTELPRNSSVVFRKKAEDDIKLSKYIPMNKCLKATLTPQPC